MVGCKSKNGHQKNSRKIGLCAQKLLATLRSIVNMIEGTYVTFLCLIFNELQHFITIQDSFQNNMGLILA